MRQSRLRSAKGRGWHFTGESRRIGRVLRLLKRYPERSAYRNIAALQSVFRAASWVIGQRA